MSERGDAPEPGNGATGGRNQRYFAVVGTELVPVGQGETPDPKESIEAADSWLVTGGRVLALERHAQRFARAVVAAGGEGTIARTVVRRATELAGEGRVSPRVDYAGGRFRVVLRGAPERVPTVEVVTASRDPRTQPLTKGPDLAALADLQTAESARRGTTVEPILLSNGAVAEGTWSALFWWRDDELHHPADTVARLPSVTAAVVLEIARRQGVPVRQERVSPDELEGCEVWLCNALRGIRAVSTWHDGPAVAAATRAETWQARLDDARITHVRTRAAGTE